MNIDRALRIRDQAKMNLRDLYSHASHFGLPHRDMNQRRLDLFERVGVNKAPHWVRAYLDGYWEALMDAAYRFDLVHGGLYQGNFYSTHSNRADYYGKHGIEPSAYADDGRVTARGHYWSNSLKPFFTMEDAA